MDGAQQRSTPSVASILKAYWLPTILFSAALFFQLFVIPNSFPPSRYDVLGIKRYSTIGEVNEAYEKLSSKWNSDVEIPGTIDFIEIRYAFELLTNPLWKRNYDIYGIDEQLHVVEELKGKYAGKNFLEIDLPLLDSAYSDPGDHAFNVITSKDFQSMFENTKGLLVQVYSSGSNYSAQFSNNWKRIATLLDGVANTGMVELGEVELVTYLTEKKPTGQPFFRNGVPSLIAFPPGCKTSECLVRYNGELSVDAVTDWFATTVLSLPRILYYTRESLGQSFLAKSGPHKVKVIFFSITGERATPFVRQAAKSYWPYASFAFVLWREEESSFWWNTFEVESAPAIVFLKDPGVKPVVYHGSVNNTFYLNIMEQNKQQELPQLRSVTSMELGCDARGYSRAGNDTMTWYCVILAGRLSPELNKMRETMRRVQEMLLNDDEVDAAAKDEWFAPSAIVLKEKRLTFTWLEGEAQKKLCFFYLHSESSYETCGPRRDVTDVPQLLIVRYKRNATEESSKVKKKANNIWDAFQDDEVDPASQLVAKYNGSDEIPQIIQWISKIVKDGDSRDLPFFRTKTPELIPEDVEPIWSRGAQSLVSTGMGMKQRIQSFLSNMYYNYGDPRIGPILLLGALMSFGSIWLRRSQSSEPAQSNQPTQATTEEDKIREKWRRRGRSGANKEKASSITDMESKDAYQMPLLDSDSD